MKWARWEAWIKAGTGDDKTDIVVIADFWQRTGGVFSRDRDISSNGFFIPFGRLRRAQRQRAWPCARPSAASQDVLRSYWANTIWG